MATEGDTARERNRRLVRRLSRNVVVAITTLALSLGGGMVLYHWAEGMDWIDAFVNVSMMVSGMGPLGSPVTDQGKLVAGFFALFSGFMLVGIWGLILAPFVQHVTARLNRSERE